MSYFEELGDEEKARLELHSSYLVSKGGFWDGDQFADFIHDNNYYVRRNTQQSKYLSFDHEVLKRVVERYLLPALPVCIEIHTFPTPHNPVRVTEEYWDEIYTLPNIVVTITEEQLRKVCEQVKQDFLQEVND